MNSSIARTTLATAVALATVAGTAGAADAAPQTCAEALSGDKTGALTVPADATCSLTDVVVRGDLIIEQGATLDALATRVRGKITLASGVAVTLTDTRVNGAITAASGPVRDAALTVRSSVARAGIDLDSVPSGPGSVGQPLALTIDQGSRVVGSVRTKGVWIQLSDSRITGDLSSDWGHAMTVDGAVVRGATTIANNYGGEARVCGSTLAGPAVFAGSRMGTHLGDKCEGNTFRSDLTVDGNYGVTFSNNLVRGAATGTNAVSLGKGIHGHSNRFRAARSGDFADASLSR